jgi:hypothetical protein
MIGRVRCRAPGAALRRPPPRFGTVRVSTFFVVADDAKPVADSAVVASVVEPEGLRLVLTRHRAEQADAVFLLR